MMTRNLSRKEQFFLSILIFIGVVALVFTMLKITACSQIEEQQIYISEGMEYVQVSSGLAHTCALDLDGHIDCWGCMNPEFSFGQCGPFEDVYIQVSAGGAHTCAIRTDGRVECQGCQGSLLDLVNVESGQCDTYNITAQEISAGFNFTEAVTLIGDRVCWGDCPTADETYEVFYEPYGVLPLQLVGDDYEQQLLVGQCI